MSQQRSLKELAYVFLKLGCLGFGGPLAHVALMDRECVVKRAWLDRATFLDLFATTQLIPGPNSTELALHIGHRERGALGLLVAGFAFVMPACIASWLLAMAYQHWGQTILATNLLYWIRPIVSIIVLMALWNFVRGIPGRLRLGIGMTAAILLHSIGLNEVACIFLIATLFALSQGRGRNFVGILPLTPVSTPLQGSPELITVFGAFLKIGSILYGSGYSLLVYLREEFVIRHGWLSDAQLVDAISAGQLTPGPLFSTATFVGYLLKGSSGAWLATIGIFLPAFIIISLSAQLLPLWQRQAWSRPFLDGINAAALGLMLITIVALGRSSLANPTQMAIGLGSWLLLTKTRIEPTSLIAAGIFAGFLQWLIVR